MDLTTARDLRLMAEEYFIEASRLEGTLECENLKPAIEKGGPWSQQSNIYRAKAAEYDDLRGAARSSAEAIEYCHLKQNYASLAEHLDCVTATPARPLVPTRMR